MTEPKTASMYPAGDPDFATPPGETIREFLDELGTSQRQLATRLDLSPKHLNQLVQGLVPLSPEIALRLELVTGMPARLWNRLEADYRTSLMRLRDREDFDELAAWVKEEVPVQELVRRGALPESPKDPHSRIQQVLMFFGVAHLSTYRELYDKPAVSFRQTTAFTAKPGSVAAWLRLGELSAREIQCEPYSRATLEAALPDLRHLTLQQAEEFVPAIREISARCGVAVVFIPEISGARSCGATKRLSRDKAMVMLSDRYKTNDQFWFTFFHELCHVIRHDKREVWIEDAAKSDDPDEAEANQFASDLLIPPEHAERLGALSRLDEVKRFADEIGVAPGIVVGRLQRQRVLSYSVGNKLKDRFDLGMPD